MVTKRIIPCLDVDDGMVVKGVQFQNLRQVASPAQAAMDYYRGGADELLFLDVGASYKNRTTLLDIVDRVSRQIFIPLTVGGGIRTVDDMRAALCAGADKVSVCSAAIQRPELIREAAEHFGSQCVVLSLDARRHGNSWYAYTCGGRHNSGVDALAWVQHAVSLGAGEILINSIDNDGTRAGVDVALTSAIAASVSVPVIASGGVGTLEHMYEAIQHGDADAVLAASILHDGDFTIEEIKNYLLKKGVSIRC
ncbi:MAG: imidazole glycerol phosphate synthase subunit HisF [Chitinivibrionales bacterium]|nr:imidazole glycerol phosphate synthase subunit HisF [Chitinivibrionales bacterium]